MRTPDLKRLEAIGNQLISALENENRWSRESCKHPDERNLHDQWAKARLAVERVKEEYLLAMKACRKKPGYSAENADAAVGF